jgi:hypothetical protein
MADLAQHYRITRTIGAAMIASLLVYAVVVQIVRARLRPSRASRASPSGTSCASPSSGSRWPTRSSSGYSGPGSSRPGLPAWRRALRVGVLGFVLFLVAGSSVDFYFFLVPSLLLFGIHFPLWNQWEDWARQMTSLA